MNFLYFYIKFSSEGKTTSFFYVTSSSIDTTNFAQTNFICQNYGKKISIMSIKILQNWQKRRATFVRFVYPSSPLNPHSIYIFPLLKLQIVYRRYHLLSLNSRTDAHRFCQSLSSGCHMLRSDNIYATVRCHVLNSHVWIREVEWGAWT